MLVLLALAIVAGLMAKWSGKWWDPRTKDVEMGALVSSLGKALVIVLPLLLLEIAVAGSFVIVPPGHRGVVFNKLSGMRANSLQEGFNFVLPIVDEVFLYDVRLQKVEFDATAASKDLQSVSTKVALNFRPHADDVADIHRMVGRDYAEKIVHPAVQEAVKATTALYTAEELVTRREEVKRQIHELLVKQMAPAKLDATETYITDFQFSQGFAHAVESKQIAEQDSFKAKRDLDRIKIEAEQKIATAQAEARSLTLQRDAITSNLIELRKIEAQRLAIERWDGHLPQTMLGNTTPMIDVNSLSNRR
jgi:regulator of protease activity HflC (stomatin/prohibitin superfamily)